MGTYTDIIIKCCKCRNEEADAVEELMRTVYSTLDGISYAVFSKLAKQAYAAYLWSLTPEGAAFLKSEDERTEKMFTKPYDPYYYDKNPGALKREQQEERERLKKYPHSVFF